MLKLNLGCGPHKLEGYVNIDIHPSADLQLDLEAARLPYEDESVDIIYSSHVFEHIKNLIPLMNECHRVMKPGSIINIAVPHVPWLEAFSDPTHVRFFTTETWRYWLKDDFMHEGVGVGYGILPFSQMKQSTKDFNLITQLVK